MAEFTHRAIENCRNRFEAGEAEALLDAVDLCARTATAIPLWLSEAFCSRYIAWRTYQHKTLDQAFGVERKGERIPERRKRELLKARVAVAVDKAHRQDKLPIDEAMFESVGKTLKLKPGTVRDIYYNDNFFRKFLEGIPRKPAS